MVESVPEQPPAAPPAEDEHKAAMKAFADSLLQRNPTIVGSLEDILYEDAQRVGDIQVPSGRLNANGAEVMVTVRVRDIGDKGLLAAYEDAKGKAERLPKDAADRAQKVEDIEREAHIMLWERCIVEPKALSTRAGILESWPRLPTRFREGLTVRILRANGVQGFLEALSLL